MGQNRSTAVMQRRAEPHKSLDDFPTPPWATRALCEWIERHTECDLSISTCREPAANLGHMVKPLSEYFASVEASDIFDYGADFPVSDYLFGPAPARTDWTITNPPFRLAEQFIARALDASPYFAVIVRTAFLESIGRYNDLFSKTPPAAILQFSERVVMHKGKLSEKGSTATAYCWLVWRAGHHGKTSFHWIPPCRKQLEREGDYPEVGE